MKQVILALLLLGLAVPGSAQAGKAPVVAAKQVKTVTNAFKPVFLRFRMCPAKCLNSNMLWSAVLWRLPNKCIANKWPKC